MLSLCIPIYNFDISPLLAELSLQIKNAAIPTEIILIDDCSSPEFQQINKKYAQTNHFIQLNQNIGRSKIRNHFLNYAKYENLLFLDCDSLIISDDFIAKYIEIIQKQQYSIVYGGRIYPQTPPDKTKILRWKYGIQKESKSVQHRQLELNRSFQTNNFLIKRSIFEQIKFDERLSEYGHEDTLFGFRLLQKKITITHIDNPILNGDLETNTEYLLKTEQGIYNLVRILEYLDYDSDFIQQVTILKYYNKLKTLKLNKLFQLIFRLFQPILRKCLSNGNTNLILFNFYKLGLLTAIINKT